MAAQVEKSQASMAEKDEGKALRIVWNVPPDFPSQYATHLVVQHTQHDFTISFFSIPPPLLVGPPEEKGKQLDALESVVAQPLARIVVAASRMPEFVQVVQDNLKTYRESFPSKEASE